MRPFCLHGTSCLVKLGEKRESGGCVWGGGGGSGGERWLGWYGEQRECLRSGDRKRGESVGGGRRGGTRVVFGGGGWMRQGSGEVVNGEMLHVPSCPVSEDPCL